MKGFNPTEWAIRHKALVIYFMLVCLVAGFSAYQHLGRNEDPEFTVKTMVVQTLWPGATQEETMQQVTDRIEKKLQDTPNLFYLKSYTVAGTSTVFVYLLESTPKKDVPDLWYQVRKKVGDIRQTLPQGIVGPFFNDEFGDTYGIIYGFTADGFSHRELRDYAEEARSRLLRVKDVSKAEFLGTQDERIYVEFSTHRLAELGMDRMELVQALVTQNAVVPSGVIQTKNEAVLMDVTGRFESEKDLQQVNFVFGGKMLRLGDIATITRGYADPPQPKFRVNGKDAIGVALSMRTGGDIIALEKNLDHAMEEFKADLPIGIEPFLVSNQPKVVEEAVNEFMKALWEAIAIVLVPERSRLATSTTAAMSAWTSASRPDLSAPMSSTMSSSTAPSASARRASATLMSVTWSPCGKPMVVPTLTSVPTFALMCVPPAAEVRVKPSSSARAPW